MSGDRLTLSQISLLTAYAAGQLLFKMAANSYGTANVGTGERLLALFLQSLFSFSACAVRRLCTSMGVDS